MNNLSRLLQVIKDNPVMYLDKPSITCLHSFLTGYLSQRIHLGLDREGSGIEGFQEWIEEKAKAKVSQSWAGIILFGSGSERSAFYRFFKEFEMFSDWKKNLRNQEENESKEKSITKEDLRFRSFDIYGELLVSIKKRPGMYLGTSSITKLDMLLRGYSQARREVGIHPTEQEKNFEVFQEWIKEKYGIKSGQSWSKIILFYCVDDYEALAKFFELYEEYLNRDKRSDDVSRHSKKAACQ